MSSSNYNIYDERYPYFITTGIRFGLPLFSNPRAAKIILQNLQFIREERAVKLIAYVVMENHLHAIVKGNDLATMISRFKSYSARKIIDLLRQQTNTRWLMRLKKVTPNHKTDRDFQFWKEDVHPKQIEGDDMLTQKIAYIHQNPVKRGYVDKPVHWRYSSARNYQDMEGLITVDMFEGRGRIS